MSGRRAYSRRIATGRSLNDDANPSTNENEAEEEEFIEDPAEGDRSVALLWNSQLRTQYRRASISSTPRYVPGIPSLRDSSEVGQDFDSSSRPRSSDQYGLPTNDVPALSLGSNWGTNSTATAPYSSLSCTQCDEIFTGIYAQDNLSHHIKSIHAPVAWSRTMVQFETEKKEEDNSSQDTHAKTGQHQRNVEIQSSQQTREDGEIRLRVGASAPLGLQFNAEDGLADLVIGNSMPEALRNNLDEGQAEAQSSSEEKPEDNGVSRSNSPFKPFMHTNPKRFIQDIFERRKKRRIRDLEADLSQLEKNARNAHISDDQLRIEMLVIEAELRELGATIGIRAAKLSNTITPPTHDNGLLFITKNTPADSKWKKMLRNVHKEAMINYLEKEKKQKNAEFLLGESPHLFEEYKNLDSIDWKNIRTQLPESWMWDVDYHKTHNMDGDDHGCWTYTPTEPDDPKNFPLTIAGSPVVLPVEHQWPPIAGVNPPPDPRPSAPIDCTAELPLEVIRDLFLTFEGSIGFYLLVNGLLQIIVGTDFDTEWASSHLPHKYGGLKVCYIPQSMDPTMFPSKVETINWKVSKVSQSSALSSIFRQSRPSTDSLAQRLQLNDFIEARTKSSHRKEKFAGRIGLKTNKSGDSYLVMSSHVITEAILAKPTRAAIFSRNRDRYEKLEGDWNEHVEIWAGNEQIGTIEKSFDPDAEIYPNGFMHDITLIKPTNPSTVKDIQSPIPDLGWLSRESWYGLKQQSSAVKILRETENHQSAKTFKTNRRSDLLVVGEGIFRNQTASPKPNKDHGISTWKDFVSRALLYRVYPDFDPPNGYSGIALYAEGLREDRTTGPGVVGFQSFVQRSGHVQNFEMEGGALEKRLKLGRVAFYGAFQVPDVLRREYEVV